VVGRPTALAGLVLPSRQRLVIHRPSVEVAADAQHAGRGHIALAQGVGHDLAGTSAQGQPQPAFGGALAHKGLQLLEFDFSGPLGRGKAGQGGAFFLTTISPPGARRQRGASAPASSSARGRRAESYPGVPASRPCCQVRAASSGRRCGRSSAVYHWLGGHSYITGPFDHNARSFPSY
jgi:hypothetical protein